MTTDKTPPRLVSLLLNFAVLLTIYRLAIFASTVWPATSEPYPSVGFPLFRELLALLLSVAILILTIGAIRQRPGARLPLTVCCLALLGFELESSWTYVASGAHLRATLMPEWLALCGVFVIPLALLAMVVFLQTGTFTRYLQSRM